MDNGDKSSWSSSPNSSPNYDLTPYQAQPSRGRPLTGKTHFRRNLFPDQVPAVVSPPMTTAAFFQGFHLQQTYQWPTPTMDRSVSTLWPNNFTTFFKLFCSWNHRWSTIPKEDNLFRRPLGTDHPLLQHLDHVCHLQHHLDHVLVENANSAEIMAKPAVCIGVMYCVIQQPVSLSARSCELMSVRFAVVLKIMRIPEITVPNWKRKRRWNTPFQSVSRKPNVRAMDNSASKTFAHSKHWIFDLLVFAMLPFCHFLCS